MVCPRCGEGRAVVKDTRDVDFAKVRRFRECNKCKYRFVTIEVEESCSYAPFTNPYMNK